MNRTMSEQRTTDAAPSCKPLTRREMAARVAADIPEGFYVNLGIGVPLQVADFMPADREVIIHSENGILGMGPAPAPDKIDRWLINASKNYVTLRDRRLLYAPRRQFCADPRRPSRPLRARRVSGRGRTATSPIGRPPTTTPRPRSAARWILPPAPKPALGADGAHDQIGRQPAGAPLHLSAHRDRARSSASIPISPCST